VISGVDGDVNGGKRWEEEVNEDGSPCPPLPLHTGSLCKEELPTGGHLTGELSEFSAFPRYATSISAAAASASAATTAITSSSDSPLFLLAGCEPDAGSASGDSGVINSEELGGRYILTGNEELKWQRKACLAYAPKWSTEETRSLIATLLSVFNPAARGPTVPVPSEITPTTWIYVLQAAGALNPARTASDIRDHYHALREAGDGKFEDLVADLLKSVGVGVLSGAQAAAAAAAAAASASVSMVTPPVNEAPPLEDSVMVSAAAATVSASPSRGGAAGPLPAVATAATAAAAAAATKARRITTSSLAIASSNAASAAQASALKRALASLPAWPPPPDSAHSIPYASSTQRCMERSRATLEWESQVVGVEVALSAMGARSMPLGTDRRGRSYYLFGPCPSEVWVQDPPPPHTPAASASSSKHLQSSVASRSSTLAMNAHRAWNVIDTPAALDAALGWLLPNGITEGVLRDALLRWRPILTSSMTLLHRSHAVYMMRDKSNINKKMSNKKPLLLGEAAPTTTTLSPSTPQTQDSTHPPVMSESGQCIFCGGSFGLVSGVTLLHCHITHVSFPAPSGPAGALAAAAFAAHTQSAWAAAASKPLTRALAVLTAAAASADTDASCCWDIGEVLGTLCASMGVPLEDLTTALDPRLLRLKRLALAIASNSDFSRLYNPAHWPPPARAHWTHTVLTATSTSGLLLALETLESALRADDIAAAGGSLNPPPNAWLPSWYLLCVPSTTAALSVPTISACTLRLLALQRALSVFALHRVSPA